MVAPSKKPGWRVTRTTRASARLLRKDLTDAERIIWNAVRAHRLNGASFRRQVPVGGFIADFVCHAAMLIIEIDGGQHFDDENERRDARRTAALKAKGFRVLRFNNHEVMTNRIGVLETIVTAIASPSPALPRKRGRERTRARRTVRHRRGEAS